MARAPVRTACAATRRFFELVDSSELYLQELSAKSGVSTETMRNWRSGRFDASLMNMEAIADVLGFEITFRPKTSNQELPL